MKCVKTTLFVKWISYKKRFTCPNLIIVVQSKNSFTTRLQLPSVFKGWSIIFQWMYVTNLLASYIIIYEIWKKKTNHILHKDAFGFALKKQNLRSRGRLKNGSNQTNLWELFLFFFVSFLFPILLQSNKIVRILYLHFVFSLSFFLF